MQAGTRKHSDPDLILRKVAEDFEALVIEIEGALDLLANSGMGEVEIERLRRAKKGAERAAALARARLTK